MRKRTTQLNVRLTTNEAKMLEELAALNERSLSETLRGLIRGTHYMFADTKRKLKKDPEKYTSEFDIKVESIVENITIEPDLHIDPDFDNEP